MDSQRYYGAINKQEETCYVSNESKFIIEETQVMASCTN